MAEEKKRLIVIDANSVLHRAYHALPPLTTKKGELVNAIYGFLLVLFKAVREFQPDYIAACFDTPQLTFRHQKFKEYKAKRPPLPEELSQQIPKVKEALKAFDIPIFEKEGFEADDIIGTISKKFQKKQVFPKVEIIILSGDLDTLQLVDNQTRVYFLKKGVKETTFYNEERVKERYQGLGPEQILDFKALTGDPSDNVPGVKGIGEKTAIKLLREFRNLENLYQNLKEVGKLNPKLMEVLIQAKDQVFFNKTLIDIKTDLLIDFDFEKNQWEGYNRKKVEEVLNQLEFYSLLKKLPESDKKMRLF